MTHSYGLLGKYPARPHVFECFVLKWWHSLGRWWNIQRWIFLEEVGHWKEKALRFSSLALLPVHAVLPMQRDQPASCSCHYVFPATVSEQNPAFTDCLRWGYLVAAVRRVNQSTHLVQKLTRSAQERRGLTNGHWEMRDVKLTGLSPQGRMRTPVFCTERW